MTTLTQSPPLFSPNYILRPEMPLAQHFVLKVFSFFDILFIERLFFLRHLSNFPEKQLFSPTKIKKIALAFPSWMIYTICHGGEKWGKVGNPSPFPFVWVPVRRSERQVACVIGQYQHNIDAKGRLFIPAKFREELGETFYVTTGLDGCLSVYSEEKWADLTAKFDALPSSKARTMRRALFANTAECQPDKQGRILIPANLRKYAALEKEVIINGVSKYLELWNPQRWAPIEEEGLDPENLTAAMEELGF